MSDDQSFSEEVFKAWWPWSLRGSQWPISQLCASLDSQQEGGRLSHTFLHLLFPQLGPFHPPPGSLLRLSRWNLATCPSVLAEYSPGFHLLPGVTFPEAMTPQYLNLAIDPLTQTPPNVHKGPPCDPNKLPLGGVVIDSHPGSVSSYFHRIMRISIIWSPGRRKA